MSATTGSTTLVPLEPDEVQRVIGCLTERPPHDVPFGCELTVEQDVISRVIDHVSNIHYVGWLDRAAELHSDACGYTRAALLNDGVMWFVARHEIDYLQECHLGDELTVLTWVRSARRVKAWRDYWIVRTSDQSIVCRASTLWVLVDLHTRRPRRMPQRMTDALDPIEEPALTAKG